MTHSELKRKIRALEERLSEPGLAGLPITEMVIYRPPTEGNPVAEVEIYDMRKGLGWADRRIRPATEAEQEDMDRMTRHA